MNENSNDDKSNAGVDVELGVEVDDVQVDIEDAALAEKGSDLKERVLSAGCWLRVVFMVLFALILCVATYVIAALVVLQFIWSLVKGETNSHLKQFGSSLSQYIYQVLCFLTYNTEDKPFPFTDWPGSEKQP